jgi:FKBP-type peptidyl-prolyl cis-trans isomerase FkpA
MLLRRRALAAVISVVATALWSASCTDAPATPSPNAPFSETDLALGSGVTATSGGTLTVDYTGWFYDGTKTDSKGVQFDSSLYQTPFTFVLGSGQVIKGWDQGVAGMRVGGVRRLVVPPALAYGSTRSGIIPPNTTLVFDINLLGVQ